MKALDYKKDEKNIYALKNIPHIITLVPMKYFTIKGIGNPNEENFSKCVEALYSLAYSVKMSYKQEYKPKEYYDYTVYPLEGFWDISDDAKIRGTFTKDDFVYKLMIRQPDFVDENFSNFIINETLKKKKNPLINTVNFEIIEESLCVQILHIGSYDEEYKSFALMDEFCKNHNLMRSSLTHKEIYLSDARRVDSSKLKTILRYQVKEL